MAACQGVLWGRAGVMPRALGVVPLGSQCRAFTMGYQWQPDTWVSLGLGLEMVEGELEEP